jgi:hypothetical protein
VFSDSDVEDTDDEADQEHPVGGPAPAANDVAVAPQNQHLAKEDQVIAASEQDVPGYDQNQIMDDVAAVDVSHSIVPDLSDTTPGEQEAREQSPDEQTGLRRSERLRQRRA